VVPVWWVSVHTATRQRGFQWSVKHSPVWLVVHHNY